MKYWRSCSLTSTHLTRHLVDFVCADGGSIEQCLHGSGLTTQMLADPAVKIRTLDEHVVLRNVSKLLQPRHFSKEIGLSAPVTAYGFLGYAMLTAPTLVKSLELINEFPALVSNNFTVTVASSEDTARFKFGGYSGPYDLREAYTDIAVWSFARALSDLLGASVGEISIGLEHCRNSELLSFAAPFDLKREDYDAPFSFIEISSEFLNRALPLSNYVSHQEALAACHRQNQEFSADREWLTSVKVILGQTLADPATLEDVAAQLRCSPRTLRRQLQIYKTSYRKLLDEVRFERAKELLKAGEIQTFDIAEQLGFADCASFHRAFSRWSGQSPGAYRA